MKIHRFYLPKETLIEDLIAGKQLSVADEDLVHQWTKVLRYQAGDTCVLFFGDGKECLVRFVSLEKRKVVFQVEEVANRPYVGVQVALVSAVIRKERYEWLVEKGTELGVAEFYPVFSGRSEEKMYKPERLEKISIEATEQSGRVFVPKIHPVGELQNVLNQLITNGYQICVLDFERDNPLETIRAMEKTKIAFVIGPEGGWSLEDQAVFASLSHKKIAFGAQTLRAETAGVAAATLALLSFYQE